MTRDNFLKSLQDCLRPLSESEIQDQLRYYDELISDMLEDGISEEAALKKLGSPRQIADEILQDQPLPRIVKNRFKPKNGWTAAAVAALIIGSPVWLSLLIALIAVAFSLVLTVFALVFSLFVTVLSMAAGGIFFIIRAFGLFSLGAGYGIFSLGLGLMLLGLFCLGFLGAAYAAAGLFKGLRRLYRSFKSGLMKKEEQ